MASEAKVAIPEIIHEQKDEVRAFAATISSLSAGQSRKRKQSYGGGSMLQHSLADL